MGKVIRVLVVDDSPFMRKIITNVIESDSRLQVIATARNGKEGLQKILEYKPDIVTLDIEMPIMNGLETLKLIMEKQPIPVVMFSSLTKEGAEETIKALEYGAVDFLTKPTNIFNANVEEDTKQIIEKIIAASSVNVKQKINLFTKKTEIQYRIEPIVRKYPSEKMTSIVAIGVSTGGPKALQEVIAHLPSEIPAGVLIVQHMPPGFTRSLAERLNNLSKITVKEAQDGDIIESGVALIAPGDKHMLVEKNGKGQYIIKLSSIPPEGGHRPAANVMYRSLQHLVGIQLIGVIMTGMGADGCEGLKILKKTTDIKVIAQNEESCVVYGMPKAVIEAGIADRIVSLHDIPKEITTMLGGF